MNGKAELSVAIVGTHADLVLKKQLIISVENTYVAYYFVKTLVFFWIVWWKEKQYLFEIRNNL